jgi:glucose-1-phosphate adenylyltransferase
VLAGPLLIGLDRGWQCGEEPVCHSWSRVDRAVILNNSRVGRRAVVEHATLDKDVVVLEGATVGVDKERDRARGLTVSPGGVTVVGKGQAVAP